MTAPLNMNEFFDLVRKTGVVDEKRLDAHVQKLKSAGLLPPEPAKIAGVLIRDGFLTKFQAENIMQGRWRRFTIGKYKVLEKIGSGGMGQVYLCEHKLMRRRVAIKVLPTAQANDDAARERFYREARAVAALDHPNIVHAYDIDQDDKLHFLVMEYVEGSNLQDIVNKSGPLEVNRACHYIRQAALGLEHAHQQAHIVHRDIKPGNILVDRAGVVKILDMGLARLLNDEDDNLTQKRDENILGTADFLAPEQALDSHDVDIRADIYSLGATFFYLLTGQTPFGEGTNSQKLLWLQTRQIKRLSEFRPDLPPGIQEILSKMMAKEPSGRYDTPGLVAEALLPYTQTPIDPPPESEMPQLSPAARGAGSQDASSSTAVIKLPSGPRLNKPPSAPSIPAPLSGPRSQVTARSNAKTDPVPAAQGSMALPASAEEEKAPWENIDTYDPAAQHDTTPQSARAGRRAGGEELARLKEKRRLWMVVIALWLLLMLSITTMYLKSSNNQPANQETRRLPLKVARDEPGGFKSIKQALGAAQDGDVIEIHEAQHRENLEVLQRGWGVTLRAAPGINVHWRSNQKDEKAPLILISNAPNFHIKGEGITLDGMMDADHKVHDLVRIIYSSPGLTIEDLHFKNIGQNAVKMINAQGKENQPIRLINLSVAAADFQKDAVGIAFDADPEHVNDYIEIRELRGLAIPTQKKDNVLGGNVKLP